MENTFFKKIITGILLTTICISFISCRNSTIKNSKEKEIISKTQTLTEDSDFTIPCKYKDLIFTISYGNKKILYALNSKTGIVEWKYSIMEDFFIKPIGIPFISEKDNTLYLITTNDRTEEDNIYYLHALNATNGKLFFKKVIPIKSLIIPQPFLYKDLILLRTRGGGFHYAIDRRTCKIMWYAEKPIYSLNPIVEDNLLYGVGGYNEMNFIYIFDPVIGKIVKKIDGPWEDYNVSDIALTSNHIVHFNKEKSSLTLYSLRNQETKSKMYYNISYKSLLDVLEYKDLLYLFFLCENGDNKIICVDLNTSKEIWNYEETSKYFLSNVEVNADYLCIFLSSVKYEKEVEEIKILHLIDSKTGKELWKKSFSLPFIPNVPDGFLLNKEVVYTNIFGRSLTAINVKTGTEIWKFHDN